MIPASHWTPQTASPGVAPRQTLTIITWVKENFVQIPALSMTALLDTTETTLTSRASRYGQLNSP